MANNPNPEVRRFKFPPRNPKSTVIMIRNGITIAVLVFYREALVDKAFLVFRDEISVRIKITRILSAYFLMT